MNEAIVSHDGPGHAWLASLGRRGMELGLQRIQTLLQRLGAPQQAFAVVAVAGTDGKGSTSAMLASLLQAAELKVGHYTSPHLLETRERVAVNGVATTAEALDRALAQVQGACHTDLDPTPFEALTAAALLIFASDHVDVAVLEVGLGGRLDAVNATEPVVSVITHLDYDHVAVLGHSLQQIAWEKAAIARDGRALVCAQPGLIKPALRKHGLVPRLLTLGHDIVVQQPGDLHRQWLSRAQLAGPALGDSLPIELSLPGAHQLDNAALAALAYLAFAEWWLGMHSKSLPPLDEVTPALAEVAWPLRAEILGTEPLVVADAAHNPSGIAAFAEWLGARGRGWQIMLAVRNDRDAEQLLRHLAPVTACFWLPRCTGTTLRTAEELAELVDRVAPACAVAVGSAHKCLEQARREVGKGPGVAITGSQHALGEWLKTGVLASPQLNRRLALAKEPAIKSAG